MAATTMMIRSRADGCTVQWQNALFKVQGHRDEHTDVRLCETWNSNSTLITSVF